MSLDWSDNTETDFNHYEVFRSTIQGGPYTKQSTTNLTTSAFTDNVNVQNGTTYYYVVQAFDNSTNPSGFSAEKSATPTAPPPDLTPPDRRPNLTATGGNAQVALNWDDNTRARLQPLRRLPRNDHGRPVHEAEHRQPDRIRSSPTRPTSRTGRPTSTSCAPTTTTPTRATRRPRSRRRRPRRRPDLTPPAAPTAFTATAGNATVALDWADNTEPDFNHYDLFRSTTTGGPYLKQNTTNLTVSAVHRHQRHQRHDLLLRRSRLRQQQQREQPLDGEVGHPDRARGPAARSDRLRG